MRLSDCAESKDNNFNLIRVFAALTVLVAHSFPLSQGEQDHTTALHAVAGMAASMAVNVFFALSGFLVTKSLLQRADVRGFLIARAARIYPALWLVTLVLTFVCGPALTSLPVDVYLLAQKTYFYLLKVSTLVFGVAFGLPGVFESNPFPRSVNGSLWTLPHEVRLYLLLSLAWWLVIQKWQWSLRAFKWLITSMGGVLVFSLVAQDIRGTHHAFVTHAALFIGGTACFLHRQVIVMHWRYLPLSLLVVCLALSLPSGLKDAVLALSLPYAVLALAYLPGGLVRKYNRLGDYSYGLYIYAFPVQQTVMHQWPALEPAQLASISMALTAPLAIFSWHAIEKPAVAYASRRSRKPR